MKAKKDGARAATQHAEDSQTDEELMAELNRLQGAITNHFAEEKRHTARIREIEDKLPVPETDLQRRIDAARSMLKVLDSERSLYYIQTAGNICRYIKKRTADECERLVFHQGLFFWFFVDQKGRWYMRHKSGKWTRERLSRIKAEMRTLHISNRRQKTHCLSELDKVELYFQTHPVELTDAVRRALDAGEVISVLEIRARCADEFVSFANALEGMRKEFGETGAGSF